MKGDERRTEILRILSSSVKPVSGISLAKTLNVSRQVIVQDIALLRTAGNDILSMNQGYLMQAGHKISRVFKVLHAEEQVEEEMATIVDYGGIVKDIFVFHKVYGLLKADIDIKSRLDIGKFKKEIETGKSSLLMNVTSGYHYHTVLADSVEILDIIQEQLEEKGFLAKLQDYEPVKFGGTT